MLKIAIFLFTAAAWPQASLPDISMDDPLAAAQGTWRGKADYGQGTYSLTVVIRGTKDVVNASYQATAPDGKVYSGFFKTLAADFGRVTRVITTSPGKWDTKAEINLIPADGTELRITGNGGDGSLAFKKDFTGCELQFESLLTSFSAKLYKHSASTEMPQLKKKKALPPAGRTGKAALKARGKKAARG